MAGVEPGLPPQTRIDGVRGVLAVEKFERRGQVVGGSAAAVVGDGQRIETGDEAPGGIVETAPVLEGQGVEHRVLGADRVPGGRLAAPQRLRQWITALAHR